LTPGNLELAQIVVSWAVSLPAVAAIIVHDERRLSGVQLERAWPPQSRDAAIFALWNFGVQHLAVLIHFVKTRWSVRGVLLGLFWFGVVVGVDVAAQLGAAAAIGWLGL